MGGQDRNQDAEPKTMPVNEEINWQWYDAKIARYACRLDISSDTDSPMMVVGKIPGGAHRVTASPGRVSRPAQLAAWQ